MSILDIDNLVNDNTFFIERWLKENCEIDGTYIIKNNEVIISGTIVITNYGITTIPIQFKTVTETFDCNGCVYLTSLKGCPEEVGGDFYCYGCTSLTTLEGAPREVGGWFSCSYCFNLQYFGTNIKARNFDCRDCFDLKSLDGCPEETVEFDCSGCVSIRSIKGPKIVNGSLNLCGCHNVCSSEDMPIVRKHILDEFSGIQSI
ncbi:MAG: hypothetical protein IKU29_02430 [Parabacteroides sp.]|nr:hypothetical protein [Parabacteroides sp.]